MGHYIRLLTASTLMVPIAELQDAFAELGEAGLTFTVEEPGPEGEDGWSFLRIFNEEGFPICDISRDVRGRGDIVEEELADFREELAEAEPRNAARWVREQLDRVQVIYAIQVLSAADDEEASDVPGMLAGLLQGYVGGLIQGDGEGFSNEDGHLIVWQFDEDAEGLWTAAVMTPEKTWEAFEMELGDLNHRAAFLAGRRPEGVVILAADEDDAEEEGPR